MTWFVLALRMATLTAAKWVLHPSEGCTTPPHLGSEGNPLDSPTNPPSEFTHEITVDLIYPACKTSFLFHTHCTSLDLYVKSRGQTLLSQPLLGPPMPHPRPCSPTLLSRVTQADPWSAKRMGGGFRLESWAGEWAVVGATGLVSTPMSVFTSTGSSCWRPAANPGQTPLGGCWLCSGLPYSCGWPVHTWAHEDAVVTAALGTFTKGWGHPGGRMACWIRPRPLLSPSLIKCVYSSWCPAAHSVAPGGFLDTLMVTCVLSTPTPPLNS